MKYPNPTFLKTASNVRRTRRNRTIIIIVCLCVVTAIVLFVMKMAAMQQQYKKDLPQLVGAATSTTESTVLTKRTHATTTTTTTTVIETTETTTVLVPSFATTTTTTTSEESSEETETTVQVNTPDVFDEAKENFYFHNTHPLQAISHDLRDQYLDDLKQSLEEYIDRYCSNKERVCIYYANLNSNETMGVNELDPIVPASAFNLPIELVYYDFCRQNLSYPYDVVTYQQDYSGNSSYIESNYTYGKQFYLRTLANLAITMNDNAALNMLMNRIGGSNVIYERINDMSSFINYTESVIYVNNLGDTCRGPYRSSCYDMVKYASELYYRYKNNPEAYQPLVNDLYNSSVPTGYAVGFGEDALILHCLGRNQQHNAYTDVAVIDDKEPLAICIYCECSDANRAAVITADLSGLVSDFIDSLH